MIIYCPECDHDIEIDEDDIADEIICPCCDCEFYVDYKTEGRYEND